MKINKNIFLGGIFFFIINSFAILKYLSLSSNVADLGFFDNNAFNYANEYHRVFFGHFEPLLILYAKLYTIFPISYFPSLLIVVQSITICLSVFFVYSIFGKLPGLAMALYYPLWANALFDFHIDHLTIPLLVAFFAGCEKRNFNFAFFSAASLVLVKEPFALQVIGCGFYFILLSRDIQQREYRNKLICLASLLIIWGSGWFYFVTEWLLPYFGNDGPGSLDSPAFSWLGNNIFDIIWTIITKPHIIILNILEEPGKIKYIIVLFGLLAFIPIISPGALIIASPILAISLLSNFENYYSYANHYTAGLIVPIIIAFRDGLSKLTKIIKIKKKYHSLIRTLLIIYLLIGHWTLSPSPISRLFWSDKVSSYNWRTYIPTQRDEIITSSILKFIPSDISITVSTQNTLNIGYLAHRRIYMLFPMGVLVPHKFLDWSNRDLSGLFNYIKTGYKSPALLQDIYSDYVIIDLKRPWFIEDKGCDWIYRVCQSNEMALQFQNLVSETSKKYILIYEYDGFFIWRSKTHSKNS